MEKSVTPHEREALARIGLNIRLARTRQRWKQYEIALKAEVHRTHLAQVEKGENATLRVILRVAGALEMHPGELFEGVPQLPSDWRGLTSEGEEPNENRG
jgi:transcriptional regulator with XRE-family HTH domain